MHIIFFDTETTGNQENDRLCQLGAKERGVDVPIVNALYKPPVPITFESMAVHHITQKMVDDKPAFVVSPEFASIKQAFESSDTVAVAHNVAFDNEMLWREGIAVARSICTYKVARALDPDDLIPNYRLQFLRYFLGLEVEGAVAHDAWGDVLVLEALFERLLGKLAEQKGGEEAAVEEMIEISSRPSLITTFRFGKHMGKKVADVAKTDRGYLEWLLSQKKQNPLDEGDWIYTLEQHIGSGQARMRF
ncbi:3'-5' exonuclease [Candidatus Kaiserbacteria bacterium]|nr:3'-5' exonuclease [Candidatus Kaiserbacteria bacterium]